MVYRLNETTWLQDAGGGAKIFYFLNWAMLTIGKKDTISQTAQIEFVRQLLAIQAELKS